MSTGWDLLCVGPDVPDLRAATADHSEGSWQRILFWFLSSCILHGEGPHTAAVGAGQRGRLEGASDGVVGRDDAPPWWRGRWAVFYAGSVPAVDLATTDAGGLSI